MLERPENILHVKIEALTDRIVRLVAYLKSKNADRNMIDQIDRAGTSIGANYSEAVFGQSRSDFRSKLNIALKEANETAYWLRKLHVANSLNDREFESIYKDVKEITFIMIATLKTMKRNDDNLQHEVR